MNIAIVGATGNVGRKTLEVFDKKNFKFDNLYLVASEKSAGKKISFRDKEYVIENLETYDFSKADITFFAAGGKIAEKYAEKVIEMEPGGDSFTGAGFVYMRCGKLGKAAETWKAGLLAQPIDQGYQITLSLIHI